MNPPRHTPSRAAALPLLLCFTITLFVSAFLLFWVQPMFAKLVLPVLGGAPAVWNTCLVFFQAMLLLGYGYAHATTRWLGVRRQAAWHLVVLLLPLWLLPLRFLVQWAPPIETNPIPWLLGVLTLTVGVPFFVVAASAPLLQAWFARTDHPGARDPYFLYAASNAGSLIALVSYPVLIEPHLRRTRSQHISSRARPSSSTSPHWPPVESRPCTFPTATSRCGRWWAISPAPWAWPVWPSGST